MSVDENSVTTPTIDQSVVDDKRRVMIDAAQKYYNIRDAIRNSLEMFGTDNILVNGVCVNMKASADALGITVTDEEILNKQISQLRQAMYDDAAALELIKTKIQEYATARGITILS